jgi:hypothetical protein
MHLDVWLTDRLNRVSHLGADDALCPIDEPAHTSEVDISCAAELKKSNDVHGTNDARRRRR